MEAAMFETMAKRTSRDEARAKQDEALNRATREEKLKVSIEVDFATAMERLDRLEEQLSEGVATMVRLRSEQSEARGAQERLMVQIQDEWLLRSIAR